MKFYYVDENNMPIPLEGTNKEIYEKTLGNATEEKSHIGVLGVIDKRKVRAVITFHAYNKTVYTTITQFIRKHAARAALERLCK